MAFRNLLDHRCDVVRPALDAQEDPHGDEGAIHEVVASNVRLALWALQAAITDYGAGETPIEATQAFLEKHVDVKERDWIVTRSGPEHPKRWRVTAEPRYPGRRFGRGAHHIEVECTRQREAFLRGYDDAVDGES
jgi:hypothetical protein